MNYPNYNRRAIVAYLAYKQDQYAMFKVFLNSIELINAKDTDIVIFYESPYAPVFEKYSDTIDIGTNNAHLILIEMESLHISDRAFEQYLYINSISCLQNQEWLKKYTYILKTDLDVVLTTKWNDYYPTGFETGLGAYNHDDNTKQQLKKVADRLQLLSKNKYQYNIGSSWYGKSEDILQVASLCVSISRELLTNEFKNFTGEWPGFFRGVTLLYASEIAINHLIDDIYINSDCLDFNSNSIDTTSLHSHIHFGHCTGIFSKHSFLLGDYDSIDINSLDTNIVNEYCLFCALTAF
ncbi:MAG: hypothetical protein NTZ19_01660 [Bacteroidetes bacterium]|nr:hypothetical protein [Bacteroidota bacterium]